MADFQAMHVVEALRSGVPSRAVGTYFSEGRPAMLRRIRDNMEAVRETGKSRGMIFTGRYGEGKTHMLNTVFSMASEAKMAVSYVCLGKETPMDKLHLLYRKIIANTYLPGKAQPGFRFLLEEMTEGSGTAGELMAYAATSLETNKIYHLLKAFLGTQEEEERALFLGDLEGDFVSPALIKKSFRRVTGKPAKFNQSFSKTRHCMDYFHFISVLFRRFGLNGWVILFDEAELMGRLGKKARSKSYRNMQAFLNPTAELEGVFSLFAFSASFADDVIVKRNEMESAEAIWASDPAALKAAKASLNAIMDAWELAPLSREEILQVLSSIQEFHGLAYDWEPRLSPETLYAATEGGGYLLRSRIRAAIELLDQLYQYGEAGSVKITALGEESLAEEAETPELPEDFADAGNGDAVWN